MQFTLFCRKICFVAKSVLSQFTRFGVEKKGQISGMSLGREKVGWEAKTPGRGDRLDELWRRRLQVSGKEKRRKLKSDIDTQAGWHLRKRKLRSIRKLRQSETKKTKKLKSSRLSPLESALQSRVFGNQWSIGVYFLALSHLKQVYCNHIGCI